MTQKDKYFEIFGAEALKKVFLFLNPWDRHDLLMDSTTKWKKTRLRKMPVFYENFWSYTNEPKYLHAQKYVYEWAYWISYLNSIIRKSNMILNKCRISDV